MVSKGSIFDLEFISSWLEQRRQKKRENENIEFSQKVIKNWIYKRDGALAKKVCYEGMLPYTRIMVCFERTIDV